MKSSADRNRNNRTSVSGSSTTYTSGTPNAQKASITLEALDLPYEVQHTLCRLAGRYKGKSDTEMLCNCMPWNIRILVDLYLRYSVQMIGCHRPELAAPSGHTFNLTYFETELTEVVLLSHEFPY